jgi:hypothetical protein
MTKKNILGFMHYLITPLRRLRRSTVPSWLQGTSAVLPEPLPPPQAFIDDPFAASLHPKVEGCLPVRLICYSTTSGAAGAPGAAIVSWLSQGLLGLVTIMTKSAAWSSGTVHQKICW